MKTIRKFLLCVGFAVMVLMISNCGKMSTGVCTGFSAEFNSTYCKDGWTEDECADWDNQQVNGVSWTFYKGQTCDERGTPATP